MWASVESALIHQAVENILFAQQMNEGETLSDVVPRVEKAIMDSDESQIALTPETWQLFT